MGVFVTLSTMLHEIPQELGEFGILLNSGLPRIIAFGYNILSRCSAILLGVLAYFFLKELQSIIPYVLAFSAASFLYISLAELIPEMHKKTTFKESVSQILLIAAGILLIFFLKD
jgi:zinc and cadmium transporter